MTQRVIEYSVKRTTGPSGRGPPQIVGRYVLAPSDRENRHIAYRQIIREVTTRTDSPPRRSVEPTHSTSNPSERPTTSSALQLRPHARVRSIPVPSSPRRTATDGQGDRDYVYRSGSGGSGGPSCRRRERDLPERTSTRTRQTSSRRDLTLPPGTQSTPYPPDSLDSDDSCYSTAAKFKRLKALDSLDDSFTREDERGSSEEMTIREYSLRYIKPELEIIANRDTCEDALSHLSEIFGTPPAEPPAEESLLTLPKFKGIDEYLKGIEKCRDEYRLSATMILRHFDRLATTNDDVDIRRPMASGLQITALEDLELDFWEGVSYILGSLGGWEDTSDKYSKRKLDAEDDFLVGTWYKRTVKDTSEATGRLRRLAKVAEEGVKYLENWPVPTEQPKDTVRPHSDQRTTETPAGEQSTRTSKRADIESHRTSSNEKRDSRSQVQVR